MEAHSATIYTIGHSTRSLDELVAALQANGIRTLVDIRAFPMSRRLPHFNRESLEQELPKHGIAYAWMKELGGRRKKLRNDSPNTGLRNDSFRNYADYMLTEEFATAIDKLVEIADPTLSARAADEDGAPAVHQDKRAAGPSAAPGTTLREMSDASSLPIKTREASDAATLGITPEDKDAGNTAIMCAERMYFQCHRMLVSDYLTAHGHTVLHIDDDRRPVRQHKLMAEARIMDGKVFYNAQQLF